ncbi:MAG: peptide chain release factor N(5)-glutamine methyltransferase [Ktedonobacteraceae bacterium]
MTTLGDAIEWGAAALAAVGLPGPRLDAQLLLGHILQVERTTLYTYPERPLTPEQERRYQLLIERRKTGEPVAYLVGHKAFFGRDFLVDKRVLIPRPETELLVEAALSTIRAMFAAERTPLIADIGTGTGIIPITLALEEPRIPYLYGIDISAVALDVARLNSQRHAVAPRLRFLQGDLLAPLPEPVDVLIANLPYVGTNEMETLSPDVRAFEPHLALFSGPEGLNLLQRFFVEAQEAGKLKAKAVLLLEIGYLQREPLLRLLQERWPQARVTFEKDYASWDRLLKVVI